MLSVIHGSQYAKEWPRRLTGPGGRKHLWEACTGYGLMWHSGEIWLLRLQATTMMLPKSPTPRPTLKAFSPAHRRVPFRPARQYRLGQGTTEDRPSCSDGPGGD